MSIRTADGSLLTYDWELNTKDRLDLDIKGYGHCQLTLEQTEQFIRDLTQIVHDVKNNRPSISTAPRHPFPGQTEIQIPTTERKWNIDDNLVNKIFMKLAESNVIYIDGFQLELELPDHCRSLAIDILQDVIKNHITYGTLPIEVSIGNPIPVCLYKAETLKSFMESLETITEQWQTAWWNLTRLDLATTIHSAIADDKLLNGKLIRRPMVQREIIYEMIHNALESKTLPTMPLRVTKNEIWSVEEQIEVLKSLRSSASRCQNRNHHPNHRD